MDEASQKDEGMWTLDDVASYLKVSKRWVQDRVADGLIRSYAMPGRGSRLVRFVPAEIRAFARATPGPQPKSA